MDLRKLKSLIKALKADGVVEYRGEDGTILRFAAEIALSPMPVSAERDEADMDLPSGVLDPRKALADIYKKQRAAES